MTISEKVSAYFDRLAAEGKLRPGDKLPKYTDIGELFKIPYASVQRAFKTMELSGKIKIVNGIGSFLNGGDRLDVDFFITHTTFPIPKLQKIVNDISERNDLHLNITVKDKDINFKSNVTEHKVVIASSDSWRTQSGSLMDYSAFPDFLEFVSQFNLFSNTGNSNIQLPFYVSTYQGMVNTRLLKKIGMEMEELSNFDFWSEAVTKCKAQGIIPAVLSVIDNTIWNFPIFDLSAILSLQKKAPTELFRFPLYTTPLGKRILDIANSCKRVTAAETDFVKGNTLLNFSIGSWFTIQNGTCFHMPESDWRIVPIRASGKHAIYYNEIFLKTFVNPTITKNERERIWTFLKQLLSKKNPQISHKN